MRELKFRAWNIPTNKMHYWGSIQCLNRDCRTFGNCIVHTDPRNIEAEYNVFEQFTGLKDRDGRDIYEGDIVEWTHALGNPKACDSGKGAIHFHYGVFHTGNIDPLGNQFNGSGYPMNASIEMTVIGNVHQHPELLTSLAKPE